jgi:DtxR family Mn-dependent transcriptional regulator
MPNSLSRTERELLKSIWRVTRDAPEAHTVVLADAIGASPATVTATVKRLATLGLVDHVPYHGAVLSASGRRAALAALRRHRLVECFLAETLNVDWTRVDALASEFEHQLPDEVADRLALALDEPTTCPHGFPIPERGATDLPTMQRLVSVEVGGRARVALPGSTEEPVVDFLRRLGVVPGAEIEVVENAPFEGQVVVRVDGAVHGISAAVADEIHVRPVVEPARPRRARATSAR